MTNPHEGRPPHPQYGAPLSGNPWVIAEVTFRPYRVGVALTARCSDDFRITIWPHIDQTRWTYSALVDGVPIRGPTGNVRRFRSDHAAAEHAVKRLKVNALPRRHA
jgi:hypothetical protein